MAYRADLITTNAFAVTPSNSTKVSGFGLYVGTTGDVALMPVYQERLASPVAVTFTACPAGMIIPLAFSRVMATNTTATNLVAFGPV